MFGYLSVLSKCELDQGLHGLSGVGIIHGLVGPWVVLKLEWNPLHPGTSLAKSAGLFSLLEPLSLFPLFFLYFFFLVAILLQLHLRLRLLLLLLLWLQLSI